VQNPRGHLQSQSPLETLCTHSFQTHWADEKSTVMTRSFTAILLASSIGLQFVATINSPERFDQLPQRGNNGWTPMRKKDQEFTARKKFADYVCTSRDSKRKASLLYWPWHL